MKRNISEKPVRNQDHQDSFNNHDNGKMYSDGRSNQQRNNPYSPPQFKDDDNDSGFNPNEEQPPAGRIQRRFVARKNTDEHISNNS